MIKHVVSAPLVMILILLTTKVLAAESDSTGPACDRSCLYQITDQYFAALELHDPTQAPTIRLVKFTENGVRMPVGDGLWNTFSGRRGYNLRAADVPRGQVVVFEVVEEHGIPALLAARFRIANRQIVEIETVLSRAIDDASSPAIPGGMATPDPLWSTPIEEALRQTRERVIPLVDGYFNTRQQNNGKLLTQFSEDCQRIENGLQVTNNAYLPGQDLAQFGCARQLELGQYAYEDRVRNRRYSVVDLEMGLVLAAGFVDHTGKLLDFQWTDGTPRKAPFFYPHSAVYFELFKIENNAIRRMESVSASVPYNMPSVW